MHDINAVIFSAAALVLLWCGWYAWAVNRNAAPNRALLALCILLALGNGAQALVHVSTSLAACIFWHRVSCIGWALYPAVAIHAAMEISRGAVLRDQRWLLPPLYFIGLVFLAYAVNATMGVASFIQNPVLQVFDPVYRDTNAWDIAYRYYQYLAAGSALGIIWLWGIRSNRQRERKQAEVILLSGIIAIGIDVIRAVITRLHPALSIESTMAWAFEHLVFAAGLTVAITQQRFIVPTANLAANYIIAHVKDLVVLTTEDGAILQVNPTATRLLGWENRELTGRKLTEYFRLTDDLPMQWPLPGCSLASSAELHALFRTRDGEEIPIELTCSYLRDAYGDVIGIIVIGADLRATLQLRHEISERIAAEEKLRRAYDTMESLVEQRTAELALANAELIEEIAERERVEQAMRASQKKFKDLFENMNEGVDLAQVVRDAHGEVIDWRNLEINPAMDRLLEQAPGSGIGLLASEMLGTARTARYLRYIAYVVNTGQPITFEAYTPDLHKHLIISMIPLEPEFFAIITMDITERKEAVLRLRESEEKYRGLFEHMSEGVTLNELVYDDAGEIVDWVVTEANHMIAQWFACPIEQIIGRRASELFGADRIDLFKPSVLAAAEGEIRTLELFSPIFNRQLIASIFAIEPGTVALVIMDITARKTAEDALRAREEELQVLFNAPVGLSMLIDLHGTLLAINEPAARRFGRTPDELVGIYAFDLLDAVTGSRRKEFVDRVFATGVMITFEDERNGVVLANTICPIFNAQGQVTRVAVFVQDITDRKRAEVALRESEEKYRALTESSTDIIMRFDRECRHIYVNAAVTAVTGIAPDAYLGKTHRELGYPAAMCTFTEQFIHQVFETGEPAETQFDFVGTRGRVYFDWRLFPEYADDGSVRSVISSARDITAVKEAEEALRTSEERFRRIVETFPGMIWMTKADPDYSSLFLSDHVEDIYGYPKEEFLSGRLSFTDIVFPEDLARVNAAVEASLAARQAYSIELRFRHKSGRTVWVMEIGAGVYDEHGNMLYLIGTVLDITERKRTELALEESEWQYQALFAHMNEGFMLCEMVYDAAGRPVDWIIGQVNPAFETMLGQNQTELIGQHGSAVFGSTEAIAPLLATCAHVAETGVPARFDAELSALGKHFVISAFSPRIGRFATIFYDVTARTQAEEQVRVYQRELLALASELSLAEERERRRIASDLHDSIIQNLALMQIMLGALRAQAGEALAPSFDDVRALLTSSIQSARTLTFELSPPVLYELGLSAALEWLGEQVQQRHGLLVTVEIVTHFRLPDDNSRAFLFSAVRELLMNVVKHAAATHVRVILAKQDDVVNITVEDDGIGFDPARVEECRGGYGLFSIRERLRHFGGALAIASRPGTGARIVLTTPLPAASSVESTPCP